MKFGGTSVGSASAIRQTARIVLEQSSRWGGVVVVVSAMSGVTDKLVRGAHTAASGDGETFRQIAAELAELHTRTADELLEAGSELHSQFLHALDRYLAEFSTLCHSVSVLGELTPRAMDTISGLGERINARLCAATLDTLGGKAQAIDATELIVTDDHFQSAAPLMASPSRALWQPPGTAAGAGCHPGGDGLHRRHARGHRHDTRAGRQRLLGGDPGRLPWTRTRCGSGPTWTG